MGVLGLRHAKRARAAAAHLHRGPYSGATRRTHTHVHFHVMHTQAHPDAHTRTLSNPVSSLAPVSPSHTRLPRAPGRTGRVWLLPAGGPQRGRRCGGPEAPQVLHAGGHPGAGRAQRHPRVPAHPHQARGGPHSRGPGPGALASASPLLRARGRRLLTARRSTWPPRPPGPKPKPLARPPPLRGP